MDDALVFLEKACGNDSARLAADAAISLPDRQPDDQIGRAGFILERHERDSLGGTRALSHENQAGNTIAPLGFQFFERSCRDDTLLLQQFAERLEGMTPK